jgi:hypothetical protein
LKKYKHVVSSLQKRKKKDNYLWENDPGFFLNVKQLHHHYVIEKSKGNFHKKLSPFWYLEYVLLKKNDKLRKNANKQLINRKKKRRISVKDYHVEREVKNGKIKNVANGNDN